MGQAPIFFIMMFLKNPVSYHISQPQYLFCDTNKNKTLFVKAPWHDQHCMCLRNTFLFLYCKLPKSRLAQHGLSHSAAQTVAVKYVPEWTHTHTHTHTQLAPDFSDRSKEDSICVWLILILQNRRWDEAEIKRDVKIYERKKSSWIWQKALETTSRCKQVWCVPWIICDSGCTHIMLLLLLKSMPVTCFQILLSDHLISFICSDWCFSAPIFHSVTISHTA